MATEIEIEVPQGTSEVRTYWVDFNKDLPDGVSISSVAASHIPPAGTASTVTVGVIANNIVPVTLPAQSVTGRHIVNVLATLGNGDISQARILIPVQWDSTRPTMAYLIGELRLMTDSGPADYRVGGMPYWTDRQLQDILDRSRTYQNLIDLQPVPDYGINTTTYTMFRSARTFWEGSAVVRNGTLGTVNPSQYVFQPDTGILTFTASQVETAYSLTGYTYDLNSAAADVWRKKIGHFSGAYDFSTDNHSFSRSQLMAQARSMMEYYDGLAAAGGGDGIFIERGDTPYAG